MSSKLSTGSAGDAGHQTQHPDQEIQRLTDRPTGSRGSRRLVRHRIWRAKYGQRSGCRSKKPWERCESGRIGLTANELTWVTGSEGSNPSLSARGVGHLVPDNLERSARPGGPAVHRHPAGPAWCEECA